MKCTMIEGAVSIGVVGAGTLGVQISAHLLNNGFQVTLKTRFSDNVNAIKGRVDKQLSKYPSIRNGAINGLTIATDYQSLSRCSVIIEAVSEVYDIKVEVLKGIELAVPADTYIFTNSSSISIDTLSQVLKLPGRFLGFHLFNPVSRMALVEIVVGDQSTGDAVKYAVELARKIGKDTVIVRNSPGFIVNRLLLWQINEASRMVTEGVSTVVDIDKAVRLGLNHPLGPFQLADLIGLDVCLLILNTLDQDLGLPGYSPSPLIKQMVSEGNLGKKSGRGFYQYGP